MSTSEAYPGTQAVLRALTLLKSFNDDQPELSLIELAQTANLNKTTTYRLLTALESEGLVRRGDGADTYQLGAEAIVIGGRAMRANTLRTVSRPELEQLAQQTRETATIEVLANGQMLTLDEVMGNHLIGAVPSIGSHWPLHVTSTGKAILAAMPSVERDQLLSFPLPAFTPQTLTTVAGLSQALIQINQQGYALAIEELEIGFVAIGAPLYDYEGRVNAALSVGGPAARLPPDRVIEIATLVKAAAQRVSAQLGFREAIVKGE